MDSGDRVEGFAPTERVDAPADGDLSRRAASGALVLAVRGLATRIAGAGGTLVIARLLVPHQFGLLAFGLTFTALAGFLVDSGVGAALIRGDEDPDRGVLGAVVGFQLLATAILVAVLAAFAAVFGLVMLLSATMAAELLFAAFRVPAGIIMERRLDYRPLATAEVSDALTYNVLAIGLVALGCGVWGVAIAAGLQAIPGTLYIVGRDPAVRIRPTLRLRSLRPIFAFGAQFQAISLVTLVREEIMAIAIGALTSFSTLGIITLANQLMQVVSLVFESLWRVSFPAMAELRRAGRDADAAITRVSRLCLLVTAILVCGLAGGLPGSITPLLGAKWNNVLEVLPGMLAGLLIVGPVSVACAGFLLAAGSARAVLRSAIAHTAVAWTVLPFLVAFGLRAISINAFLVCVTEAVILSRATASLTGKNPLVPLMPTGAAALAIAAGAWWLGTDLPKGVLGSLAVAAAAVTLLIGWYVACERETLRDFARLARPSRARFRRADREKPTTPKIAQ